MGEGKYQPTPKETIEAASHMSDKEKASSLVRQSYLESEQGKDLAKLPNDLEYDFDKHIWGPGSGTLASGISGTFGGRKMGVGERKTGKFVYNQDTKYGYRDMEQLSREFYGSIDSKEISKEEAELAWKEIYPLVKTFDEYKKDEAMAIKRVEMEEEGRKNMHAREIEELKKSFLELEKRILDSDRVKDQEAVRESATVENEARDSFKRTFEGLNIGNEDRKFLEKVWDVAKELLKGDGGIGRGEGRKIGLSYHKDPSDEAGADVLRDYCEKKVIIYKLLGVDSAKGEKWVRGWATAPYLDSMLYDTIFPGISLRERFDNRPNNRIVGAWLELERKK